MKLPMTWLKELVDIKDNVKDFADALTLSGSKVEKVEYIGKNLKNIVVGRVEQLSRHENSDKLFITQVNIGDETIQIVTGAQNLSEGDYVPVALHGAVLADGKKITKGKLRGEESNGMLCSIEELGFTRAEYPEAPEDGIYIFTEPQALGADVRPLLELCDEVVEFEITSNRPDCFSIIGLAREAAATYNLPLAIPEIPGAKAGKDAAGMIDVEIKNPALCPRYIARIVKNVKIEPSPLWMRHRLVMSGIRPINNIVDITNYVMLELGQPMHAFDIDCISGGKIIVRNAEDGESFTTLDGVERTLDSSMLVISDKDKAVAIAGVMGGENSKISGNADAVLFESANFNGPNVRVSSKKLSLRTDSSSKFEKGLDPELAELAVNRAVWLVELLGCGEPVSGMVDRYPGKTAPRTVSYSVERINALLGTEISETDMDELLARLEIRASEGIANIPSFRPDIVHETDIAEEVARLYGYNNISSTLASTQGTVGKKTDYQLFKDGLKRDMAACGCCEALSFAFESPNTFGKLKIEEDSALRNAIVIQNPLGEDFSIMRTSTVNAMLTSLATNFSRRNPEAALFEIAKTYIPKSLPLNEQPDEIELLTIGMYGCGDFFELKGIINYIEKRYGIGIEYETQSALPFMHPGRTARLSIRGKEIGFAGELHPNALESYGLETRAYVAALELAPLFENAVFVPSYSPLPRFPKIKRDIALLVKNNISAKAIADALRKKGGELLQEVKLFDVYRDEKLGDNKSMAFSLSFGAAERTLVDDEVNEAMKRIIATVEEKLGAKIRDK